MQSIKECDVETINLVIVGGLEDALLSIFPKSRFQKCVTHLIRNVSKQVNLNDKKAFLSDLRLYLTQQIIHTIKKTPMPW